MAIPLSDDKNRKDEHNSVPLESQMAMPGERSHRRSISLQNISKILRIRQRGHHERVRSYGSSGIARANSDVMEATLDNDLSFHVRARSDAAEALANYTISLGDALLDGRTNLKNIDASTIAQSPPMLLPPTLDQNNTECFYSTASGPHRLNTGSTFENLADLAYLDTRAILEDSQTCFRAPETTQDIIPPSNSSAHICIASEQRNIPQLSHESDIRGLRIYTGELRAQLPSLNTSVESRPSQQPNIGLELSDLTVRDGSKAKTFQSTNLGGLTEVTKFTESLGSPLEPNSKPTEEVRSAYNSEEDHLFTKNRNSEIDANSASRRFDVGSDGQLEESAVPAVDDSRQKVEGANLTPRWIKRSEGVLSTSMIDITHFAQKSSQEEPEDAATGSGAPQKEKKLESRLRASTISSPLTSKASEALLKKNTSSGFFSQIFGKGRTSRRSTRSNASIYNTKRDTVNSMTLPERKTDDDPRKFLDRLGHTVSRSFLAALLARGNSDFNKACLNIYFEGFDFKCLALDIALRKFLLQVVLPKETQHIDNLIMAFANRFYEQNKSAYESSDSCYYLSFALMILHTDFFNPSNKSKMSKEQFCSLCRQQNISDCILDYYYDNICYGTFVFLDEIDYNLESNHFSGNGYSSRKMSAFIQSDQKNRFEPYSSILDGSIKNLRLGQYSPRDFDAPIQVFGLHEQINFESLKSSFLRPTSINFTPSKRGLGSFFRRSRSQTSDSDGSVLVKSIRMDLAEVHWPETKRRKSKQQAQVGLILSGSYLNIFYDARWLKKLKRAISSRESSQSQEDSAFLCNVRRFKPDRICSVVNAVAFKELNDSGSDSDRKFILRDGLTNEWHIYMASTELADDWIETINFVSAMRTAGMRVFGQESESDTPTALRQRSSSERAKMAVSSRRSLCQRYAGPDRHSNSYSSDSAGKTISESVDDLIEVLKTRSAMLQLKIEEIDEQIKSTREKFDDKLRKLRQLLDSMPLLERTRQSLMESADACFDEVRRGRIQLAKLIFDRQVFTEDKKSAIKQIERLLKRNDPGSETDSNHAILNANESTELNKNLAEARSQASSVFSDHDHLEYGGMNEQRQQKEQSQPSQRENRDNQQKESAGQEELLMYNTGRNERVLTSPSLENHEGGSQLGKGSLVSEKRENSRWGDRGSMLSPKTAPELRSRRQKSIIEKISRAHSLSSRDGDSRTRRLEQHVVPGDESHLMIHGCICSIVKMPENLSKTPPRGPITHPLSPLRKLAASDSGSQINCSSDRSISSASGSDIVDS